MDLARVVGTVVSSHKSPKLEGQKFLLLEKLDAGTMKSKKDFVVSMDAVGANKGEIVFYVTGSSARLTSATEGRPTDATIVAIVDNVEKDGEFIYNSNQS
jgi:microcompartment protein CcmK/EutM